MTSIIMNILFVGMPGAGKSTISSLLSKKINKSCIEIDEHIEKKLNIPLQKYIDLYGNEKFKETEEIIILSILKNAKNNIISPPGSIIYYPKVMEYLTNNNNYIIIYLECSLDSILKRTNCFENRGVIMDLSLKNPYESLYNERVPYYEKIANFKYNSEEKLVILLDKTIELLNKKGILYST